MIKSGKFSLGIQKLVGAPFMAGRSNGLPSLITRCIKLTQVAIFRQLK
jgi:hypothetical protein